LAAARGEDVPVDGGVSVPYGTVLLAVYNFASRGEWYATQNNCPHKGDQVLARGIVGDQGGVPKVACPMHKKNFSLQDGGCISGEDLQIRTFPVRVEGGMVYVELPPRAELERDLCEAATCHADAAE
jgi:NAD(P)H-dependent nitrite reductase small subunit